MFQKGRGPLKESHKIYTHHAILYTAMYIACLVLIIWCKITEVIILINSSNFIFVFLMMHEEDNQLAKKQKFGYPKSFLNQKVCVVFYEKRNCTSTYCDCIMLCILLDCFCNYLVETDK